MSLRFLPVVLLLAYAASALGYDVSYRVVDRRQLDGTVLLIPRVPQQNVGDKPFVAADYWDLTPASEFFRVRSPRLPARYLPHKGDPPAITFRNGRVVPNRWTNVFGGKGWMFFGPGEIVRLVHINAAFKSVRLDLESVCRPEAVGRRLRSRVDFVLSEQVRKTSLDEANKAVAAVLKPIDLSRVLEVCDPHTGLPPVTLRRGMTERQVVRLLDKPRSTADRADAYILDYGVVRLELRNGRVEKIRVPAID